MAVPGSNPCHIPIWIAAALGMGTGLGDYLLVGVTTAVVLLILWTFPHFGIILQAKETLTYEATAPYDERRYQRFRQRFKENGLKIQKYTVAKKGTDMVCEWQAVGKVERHARLIHTFMNDPEVEAFTVS